MAVEKLFVRQLETTIRDAFKLKRVMKKRGLTAARARCPECDGVLWGLLAGRKQHLHFRCDGPCQRQLME